MKKLLIIIPAYNEAGNIEKVVDNIILNFPEYDYVVINDGSTDDTKKICNDNQYQLLDLATNIGLSGVIKCGMKYAQYMGYEYVIQIDGDGQHNPKYIKEMLKRMEESNCDIVIGSRFKNCKKPFTIRMIGSHLITMAIWVTTKGKYIGDVTSGMRLYNKKMIKRFADKVNYTPEPDTMAYLLNCEMKIEEIEVEMSEREAGTSYLTIGNSIRYMIHTLFAILVFQWFRERK